MAKYKVDIKSYYTFRKAVNGKTYNVDDYAGYQCWDGAALLWQQLGRTLSTGGTGAAHGCWSVPSARKTNGGTEFELIADRTKIKRGDVVVWGKDWRVYGHIAFADSDYKNPLPTFGQNQNNTGGKGNEAGFCVKNLATDKIVGAFRLKSWQKKAASVTSPVVKPVVTPPTVAKNAAVQPAKVTSTAIKVGDTVRIKSGAKSYDGKKIAAFVYSGKYRVDELKGARAVLDRKGICTAFKVEDLVRV